MDSDIEDRHSMLSAYISNNFSTNRMKFTQTLRIYKIYKVAKQELISCNSNAGPGALTGCHVFAFMVAMFFFLFSVFFTTLTFSLLIFRYFSHWKYVYKRIKADKLRHLLCNCSASRELFCERHVSAFFHPVNSGFFIQFTPDFVQCIDR